MNRPPKGDDYRRGNSAQMMFQPSAQDSPNMTVKIREGSFWVNGTNYVEYAGGTSPEITIPKTGAKWVVVAINKLGTCLIINGVAKQNNPDLPVIGKNLLQICAVYIKSSTKLITNDMIYDVRPTLAVGGYPIEHNQLTNRDASDCHTIDSITGLTDSLENKLDIVDAKDLLYSKADSTGTTSASFTLNKDESGVPVENCSLLVSRGSLPTVGIRFNEGTDSWEYTNDGTAWNEFNSSATSLSNATVYSKGIVQLSVDPVNEENPIVVGDNDPRMAKIETKADKSELNNYAKTVDVTSELLKKADVDSVYTKTDAESIFVTQAEYSGQANTYTKTQLDSFFSLKANVANVYTKTESDSTLSNYYNKSQVDALIVANPGSGTSLANYYNKAEVDGLIKAVTDDEYTKTEVDVLLTAKLDSISAANQFATKANVSDVYTKTDVDTLIKSSCGTGTTTGYTKGEMDMALAGKANVSHSHLASDISQDTNHRLVDDAEITYWNNKQEALGFTPENPANKGAVNGYASLDSTGKLPLSQIPSSITGGVVNTQTGATIVSTYADMLAITDLYVGKIVFVVDATADTTVKSGWAQYIYNNSSKFEKMGEQESLDLILDWNNVLNKPTTFAPSAHNHDDRYYTESEMDGFLSGKSDINHNHDTRYFTKAEMTTALANKSDITHTHAQLHDSNVLGTKIVDESTIGDGKSLTYNITTGKLEYKLISGGSGTSSDVSQLGTKKIDEADIGDGNAIVYQASGDKLVYKNINYLIGSKTVDETAIADKYVLSYDSTSAKLIYSKLPSRGTKEIDETNIADGKILSYNATSGKLVYIDKPTSTTTTSSKLYRYEAAGSSNGDCMILADGQGVTFSKTGSAAIITPPTGVNVITARIRFSASEMGDAAKCQIDYNSTLSDTDYTTMSQPSFSVFNDVDGNRALRSAAVNLNINAHTMQFTGVVSNIGLLIKLAY